MAGRISAGRVAIIRHNPAPALPHWVLTLAGSFTRWSRSVLEVRKWISPLFGKSVVVGGLIILLLIPLASVEDLVHERGAMRDAASRRVAESWGGAQTTGGVLLAIPVETSRLVVEQTAAGREIQRTEVDRNVLYVLPDTLEVTADAEPGYRTVGLYRTPVYLARVDISGAFAASDFAHLRQEKPGREVSREVKWSEARFMVLNSESRALRAVDDLVVAGESLRAAADGYAGSAGISAAVPAAPLRDGTRIAFRVKLTLAGSNSLMFLPLARKATLEMKSSWPHPGFIGAPAPLDPRIGDDGFSARWTVLEFNRDFPQTWYDSEVRSGLPAATAFTSTALGVNFYEPVDVYQRNYRALHYAALLIVITFLAFFLFEQLSGLAIHAMQYLMVGLGLALFYLLLLALSEHLLFAYAYALSAAALVLLITVYLSGVFRRLAPAIAAGSGLAVLYTLLYWILRSEDYSLLMGALLLFGVLALIMLATRRVDWANVGRARE
jgi:inner membrane protein